MALFGKAEEQAQGGGFGNKLMAGLGGGLASGLAGAGLNILFGGMLNRRAYEQQQKLQELQIKGAKELTDYNAQKELDMWNATNAAAQRKHLDDAGLSASLMYGGAGAGGATTGGGGGAMPSGDSGSAQLMAGMNAQSIMADIALKSAQAENIKADTDKKKEETTGVGLANIAQEIQNAVNEASKEDQVDVIRATAEKLTGEANKAAAEGAITQATQEEQINKIKYEATGAMLENQAKEQGINLSQAQIKEINAKIDQGWEQLSNQRRGQDIDAETAREMMKTILISSGIQAGGNLLNNIIDIRSGKYLKNIASGGK